MSVCRCLPANLFFKEPFWSILGSKPFSPQYNLTKNYFQLATSNQAPKKASCARVPVWWHSTWPQHKEHPSQAEHDQWQEGGQFGNEPKGDVGEYSTISRKNIICNNSREIKDFTKKIMLSWCCHLCTSCYHGCAICVHHVIMVVKSVYIMLSWWCNLYTSCYHSGAICVHHVIMVMQSVCIMLSWCCHLCISCYHGAAICVCHVIMVVQSVYIML